jgi:hypothetical protein
VSLVDRLITKKLRALVAISTEVVSVCRLGFR